MALSVQEWMGSSAHSSSVIRGSKNIGLELVSSPPLSQTAMILCFAGHMFSFTMTPLL